MGEIFWLLCANIIFWLGMAGYAIFLGVSQKGMERNLRQLEILQDDNKDG